MKNSLVRLFTIVALFSSVAQAHDSCTCTYTSIYTPDDKTLYVCILSGVNETRGRYEEIARQSLTSPKACDATRTGCSSVFKGEAGKCATWRNR